MHAALLDQINAFLVSAGRHSASIDDPWLLPLPWLCLANTRYARVLISRETRLPPGLHPPSRLREPTTAHHVAQADLETLLPITPLLNVTTLDMCVQAWDVPLFWRGLTKLTNMTFTLPPTCMALPPNLLAMTRLRALTISTDHKPRMIHFAEQCHAMLPGLTRLAFGFTGKLSGGKFRYSRCGQGAPEDCTGQLFKRANELSPTLDVVDVTFDEAPVEKWDCNVAVFMAQEDSVLWVGFDICWHNAAWQDELHALGK